MKQLVVLLFSEYPQLSQTYKENEARALLPHCEVKIVSIGKYNTSYKECLPYEHSNNKTELYSIFQQIAKFDPKIIHSHYLHMTFMAHRASMICGCKYSIRTHSFDVIGKSLDYISQFKDAINSDRCCGIICFPFLKKNLLKPE